MTQGPFVVEDLGLIDYEAAYLLQKKALAEVQSGCVQRVFLCEHPPVLTLGRLANPGYVLFPEQDLAQRGVKIIAVDRGGEVTLHAPGQLVVYPIFDLGLYGHDIRKYLFKLEQVAIDLLMDFDILTDRFSGRTGVWFGAKKIASLGVGVKKWVAFHGMGLNVNTDLTLFQWIKPCGLDVAMTSMAEIKGQTVDMAMVKNKIVGQLARHFELAVSINPPRS